MQECWILDSKFPIHGISGHFEPKWFNLKSFHGHFCDLGRINGEIFMSWQMGGGLGSGVRLFIKAVHPKKPISSLDDLILEAIVKLKEPRGSSRSSISLYIEEHYAAPPNLERLLAANLKVLTENGRLVKVKHQYRIPPSRVQLSINVKVEPSTFPLGGKQMHYLKPEKNATRILTKAQIDAELEKMKNMTAQEAAAAAAQAVAEAEAAIADAEQAAREAEEAEAEAEAAQSLAEATSKALIFQNSDYPRLIKPIF
nr:telomere repeat-binding factor 1-like [Ipomoea batatas]